MCIVTVQGDVYWTDRHSQSVLKVAHKPDSPASTAAASRPAIQRLVGGLVSPFDIKLMHTSKQPPCESDLTHSSSAVTRLVSVVLTN